MGHVKLQFCREQTKWDERGKRQWVETQWRQHRLRGSSLYTTRVDNKASSLRENLPAAVRLEQKRLKSSSLCV